MSKELLLKWLSGKEPVNFTLLIREYLINKNPDITATKITELTEAIGKNPHLMPQIVQGCLDYFEVKFNLLKIYDKNGVFLCYK